MPPRVKFQKEEIVTTALEIAREKGIDAVTAREVANALGVQKNGRLFAFLGILTYFCNKL